MSAEPAAFAKESELAARWASAPRRPLRLEDGRALRVVFPGVPGPGHGPDFRGAILEAGGDLLRGDVELHLLASGWAAHGHSGDPAFASVVLHVVAKNDARRLATVHGGTGRSIPILVLGGGRGSSHPGYVPPCVFGAASTDVQATLARMAGRRLRAKLARVEPLVAANGPGQALHALLLEYLAGGANRGAFASIARTQPLAALLEVADEGPDRALAISAALKGAAAHVALRRAGLRPLAAPGARLEAAARLIARLWPRGSPPGWPPALEPFPAGRDLLRLLAVEGIGRATAVELAVNAVLPVAVVAGSVDPDGAARLLAELPSPGTYGRLRQLEGWLGGDGFRSAADLQGALLLQSDYCLRGRCGRCPFSS